MFVLCNRTWECMSGGVLMLMYLAFTHMPGESNCSWLRLLLCLCDIFWVLMISLVCWLRFVPGNVFCCTAGTTKSPVEPLDHMFQTCKARPGLDGSHILVYHGLSMLVYTHPLIISSCLCPQLQLWLENPKIQLTLENSLAQIEPPYNSTYSAVLCTTAALLTPWLPAWHSSGEWINISCQPLAKAKRVKPVLSCSK